MMGKCPICKEKYLKGLHEKVCRERHPNKWLEYMLALVGITLTRLGREEISLIVARNKGQ